VTLEPGSYPGRWVHNGELLQILVKTNANQLESRFFDVLPDPRDPPDRNDEILREPKYQFQISVPKGKRLEDYPLLVHVYGATKLELPAGTFPGYVHCSTISYGSYGPVNTNCSVSGGGERHVGYASLEATINGSSWLVSCLRHNRWSQCGALGPGFYLARWEHEEKHRIAVLVSVDGRPGEIMFDAQEMRLPHQSEESPVRPPE
jgi:hypothetical protein